MPVWSTNKTWTTGELVTAADLNTYLRDQLDFLAGYQWAVNSDSRTYTNTSFADLDALTGGAGSMGAIAVTVETGDSALVMARCFLANSSAGGISLLSYNVSGATTISDRGLGQYESGAANDLLETSYMWVETLLTPGTNTFELRARVSTGTGDIRRPHLFVMPLAT